MRNGLCFLVYFVSMMSPLFVAAWAGSSGRSVLWLVPSVAVAAFGGWLGLMGLDFDRPEED